MLTGRTTPAWCHADASADALPHQRQVSFALLPREALDRCVDRPHLPLLLRSLVVVARPRTRRLQLPRDLVERGGSVLVPRAADAAGELGLDPLQRPHERLARHLFEPAGHADPTIRVAPRLHAP